MRKIIGFIVVLILVSVSLLNFVGSQPSLSVDITGNDTVSICEQYDYDITVVNPSDTETATDMVVTASLPTIVGEDDGFIIMDSGGGVESDSDGDGVNDTVTWNVGDLDPLASWDTTIRVEIACNAVSGQIQVDAIHSGGSVDQDSLYLTVNPGAVTVTKTPHVIEAHLDDTVHWTLTVTSTGIGPIQNVVVEDTLGAGLQYDDAQTSPTPGTVTNNGDGTTTLTWNASQIPALGTMNSGDTVTIEVYATVDACSGLENNAQASWGCDGTVCQIDSTKASVQLILDLPEISYTLPDFQIPYCSSASFTIPITNNGDGTAHDFYLYADFSPFTVTVTSPGSASYNSAEDRFELGDISSGSTVNLQFTLTINDWCGNRNVSKQILFRPEYTDDCGNTFHPPVQLGNLSTTGTPTLSASKTTPSYEMYLGEQMTYDLSVTYSGDTTCVGNSSAITITDTIPDGFAIVDAGGGSVSGSTITWTISPTAPPWSTTITLQAPSYADCEDYCYTTATNTLEATVTDCCGCTLTASDSASIYLECEQLVDSEKTVSSVTGNWEKCTEITYTNTYVFADDPDLDGESWDNMIFYEEMDNSQAYVSTQPVTITDNDNPANTCSVNITPTVAGGELVYDFSGHDFSSCPSIRNSTLVIEYNLQTTDASQPQCAGSYTFYDWSRLDTGWPNNWGQCMPDSVIQEGEQVTVQQSDMNISISGIPQMMDICGSYDITLTLTNTHSTVDAYDVKVFFPTENYSIDLGSISYGGVTPNSGPTAVSGGYEWDYGDNFTGGTSGSISLTVQKRCTGDCACSATVYFDDLCNDDDVPDVSDPTCSESAIQQPVFVRNGSIFIKKTPELVYAIENQATWKIYVVNSGNGTAYNVWVEDILDSDLAYDTSSVTDLDGNTVTGVTTNPNQDRNGNPINGVTWVIDEIPAGKTRIIELTTDITGCTNLDNDVTASWGCLGSDCQVPVTDYSRVEIPGSNAVTTNTLPADIDLCEQDTVSVEVKNTGITTVYNAEVEVTLPQGLHYVPGTGNPADPENTSANPVVWTSTEVSALASLAPAGEPGDTVTISFDVAAGCDFPDGNRRISSKVSYETVCGDPEESPLSSSTLSVNEPSISIAKDGRNVTTGQTSHTNTVNAEPGDTVEWRIRISNNGATNAQNVEFWDVLPSNMTFVSVSPAPVSGSGTSGDPWVHGNLGTGQTATYYVTGTVDANECTDPPVNNRACVQYGCDDNPTTPDTDPCREPQRCNNGRLRTTSQFTVSQTLGTITTCEGDITVTVQNNGPTAYNVEITSDLPTGFEYDSMISGPNPTPDPPADVTQPVWIIGNMAEGQIVTLHFSIVADGMSCDTVIPSANTVYVNFDNYCGQNYTRSNTRNVTPLKPVLTVEKTPETQAKEDGGTATWTITVENTGNYQAGNVEVVDVLSDNFSNIVANNGSGGEVPSISDHTVTWSLMNPISVGGTWTATLSADISGNLGMDTVTANGTCAMGCVYSTTTDDAYVQTIEGLFKSPNLQEATIGEEITFHISSSYWGTSSYQNVQIIDTLPTGLEYVTSTYLDTLGLSPTPSVVGQTITWDLGNFTGPNTVDITVTARVQDIPGNVDGVTLTNWAQTTGSEEGVSFDLSDSGVVEIIEPELTLGKHGSATEALPGDTVHYTLTIENTGTSPAYDVTIEDVVPSELILDESSITSAPGADSVTVSDNTITWEYTIIPVDSTVTLEYDVEIPLEGGTFTNTATITDYSSLLGDSQYERHYSPVSDDWTVVVPGTDILKITLNTAVNVPSPGGTVYFELTIENTGSMSLNPVQLIDTLPDGLTYIPGTTLVDGVSYEPDTVTDNTDGTQTLTWNDIQPPPDPMDPSDTIEVTFEASVDPKRAGTFINKARVIGTSSIGDVSDEDDSPIGVKSSAISVVKSINPSVISIGQTVEVWLRVTNTGKVPLDPVEVVDELPVGLTYAGGASVSPDTVTPHSDGTTTLAWNNVGLLDVGERTTLIFDAVFTGEDPPVTNLVTVTGTPPNGFAVSDDDTAQVTPPLGTSKEVWRILAYNGLYRCELCNIDEFYREARELGLTFSEERNECCEPDDLVEKLQEEIVARGLEMDIRYQKALELLECSRQCCEDAFNAYETKDYIKAYRKVHERCNAQREALKLMLDVLRDAGCGCSP